MLKVVSLFSGAGGMDLGFKQAGFKIIFANDIYSHAVTTYSKNLGQKVVRKDVRKITAFPKADVVVACNPCQGFSIIGRRNEDDERNLLYREIFRVLRIVRPKYFVVENVRGLAALYQGKYLKRMVGGFRRCGYIVRCRVVNAADYGVPQRRERIIIVGVRKDIGVRYRFPRKTHGPGLLPYVTLRKALAGMRPAKPGEYFDSLKWSPFYMSRNRRAKWNEPSYTIQTYGENIPLHPSSPSMIRIQRGMWKLGKRGRSRRLSADECARVQGFPDDYIFSGSLRSKYRLIGNAVPPLLARTIAESIAQLDERHTPAASRSNR